MITEAHFVTPEELMAYQDGELSAERAEAVAAHLPSCPGCQKLGGALRDTSQVLAGWTLRPPLAKSSFERHVSALAAESSASALHFAPASGFWQTSPASHRGTVFRHLHRRCADRGFQWTPMRQISSADGRELAGEPTRG